MSHGLTRRQRDAVDFIRDFIRNERCAPTVREIAAAMGLASTGAAHDLIAQLAARGAITHRPREARSIAIVEHDAIPVALPSDLRAQVEALARAAGVTSEAVIVEAVRDRLSALRSKSVTRETPAGQAAA